MRVKALEIRWHNTQPIFSCDFQPLPAEQYKKPTNPYERSSKPLSADVQVWRMATAGGDNHVRMWLVTPTCDAKSAPPAASTSKPTDPIKVEYLATLSRHSAVVNVVRFDPKGVTLASAGDDGTILLWSLSDKPASTLFGTEAAEEAAYERESWKIRRMLRSTQQEVYDLSWSPDGQWLISGSTDNTARIYSAADGTLVKQITDHNNYVQGVAWDPRNEYIATQSSDRHMHVYGLEIKSNHATGTHDLQFHLIGKNSKMEIHQRDRSRSTQTKRIGGNGSTASNDGGGAEFRPPAPMRSMSRASDSDRSESSSVAPVHQRPLSASTTSEVRAGTPNPLSVPSTPNPSTAMNPPPPTSSRSRRSSLSGSPTVYSNSFRTGRSPSPIPPLPAIRVPASPKMSPSMLAAPAPLSPSGVSQPLPPPAATASLYGGQEVSPFFRRLAWSTDGSLLLTPAGIFDDPFVDIKPNVKGDPPSDSASNKDTVPTNKKPKRESGVPKPTVYIYTRGNIGSPPAAHLPGHTTGSIAIRFNPVLWELRSRSAPDAQANGSGHATHVRLEPGKEEDVPLASTSNACPVEGTSPKELHRPTFDLPYRMIYAVATHGSVLIYDTQQATPLCMFGNLHYAPFTDLSWTADGMTLALSSQDGYCSLVAFERGELGEPLPLERQWRPPTTSEPALASPHSVHHHHSRPRRSNSVTSHTSATDAHQKGSSVVPALVDTVSVATEIAMAEDSTPAEEAQSSSKDARDDDRPPSKRRRVALTFQGPLPI